eukprot:1138397-Amphidinium_carterae.1
MAKAVYNSQALAHSQPCCTVSHSNVWERYVVALFATFGDLEALDSLCREGNGSHGSATHPRIACGRHGGSAAP